MRGPAVRSSIQADPPARGSRQPRRRRLEGVEPFWAIVSEKLGRGEVTADAARDVSWLGASAPHCGPAPPLLIDVPPLTCRRQDGAAAYQRDMRDTHGRGSPPMSPKRARSRRLNQLQSAALQCLQWHGADELDPSFSPAELKAAFRGLAKRFHPDRHPSCSAEQRARLAREFARIVQAYRQLVVHAA